VLVEFAIYAVHFVFMNKIVVVDNDDDDDEQYAQACIAWQRQRSFRQCVL